MDLRLSDEQLKDIVVEALFEKIDLETRKQMITGAIAELMKPTPYAYSKGPSRLQSTVEDALATIARKVCAEEFAKTEVQEKVRELVNEAFQKVFVIDRDTTVTRMAHSLSMAMRSERD